MTIEELKELKKTVRAGFYIDDTDGDEEFFRVINQSDEIRILELIDEKISQLSVTDEDVRALTGEPVINYSTKSATSIKQMNTEPCEYCNGEMEQFFEIIDANFCMRCGRKLR